GEQPPGEVLLHHRERPEAARGGNRELGAHLQRDSPSAPAGTGGRVVSTPRASRLRAFAARLRGSLHAPFHDDEFDEEMQDHLRRAAERSGAQGMPTSEAMGAARRQFGNPTLLQEDRRALQTLPSIEALGQDLRYTLRTLVRSRAFAATSIVTL